MRLDSVITLVFGTEYYLHLRVSSSSGHTPWWATYHFYCSFPRRMDTYNLTQFRVVVK